MNKKILFLLVLLTLLFSNLSYAAILHGSVYDVKLRPRNNVIIEVNSSPSQIFVSKEGQYSFVLEPGNYALSAYFEYDGIEYIANENVTISRNGYFVRDLVLESEEGDAPPEEESNKGGDGNLLYIIIIGLAVFILVLVFVFYRFVRKTHKKEKGAEDKKESSENREGLSEGSDESRLQLDEKPTEEKMDDYTNQVLNIIQSEDGRTTQKHIRKKIPLSEAKISLIITELEEKGKIKKIKKGRGNIIILQ